MNTVSIHTVAMIIIAASLSKCLGTFLPRWSATHPCFLSENIHFSYNTWNLLGVRQNFSSLHSQSNCWGREHLLPWAGFHSITSPSLLLFTYQNFNFFQPHLLRTLYQSEVSILYQNFKCFWQSFSFYSLLFNFVYSIFWWSETFNNNKICHIFLNIYTVL